MGAYTRVDVELLSRISQSPQVQAALLAKAHKVALKAKFLAYKAGATDFAKSISVVAGARPGLKSPIRIRRGFARVVATASSAEALEFGGHGVSKVAILRRAGRG